MYTLGINAAYHDSAACLVRRRRRPRGRRGRTVHPHQARQAAGAVLDLGAAVPRDRLLPAARRGSTLADVDHVAYSYDPYLLLGRPRTRRDDHAAAGAERHPTAERVGESPGTRCSSSSIVNAPRQLADGAPHHLQARFRGVAADGPFRWHFVAAPPGARGQRVPRLAVRPGRGDDARRPRREGDDRLRRRRRQPTWNGSARCNMPHSLGLLYERGDRATSASCTRRTSTR